MCQKHQNVKFEVREKRPHLLAQVTGHCGLEERVRPANAWESWHAAHAGQNKMCTKIVSHFNDERRPTHKFGNYCRTAVEMAL